MKRSSLLLVSLAALQACTEEPPPRTAASPAHAMASSGPVLGAVPEPPAEAPPLGRLRGDARPTRYALELSIDPSKDRFSGKVDIEVELAHARRVVWMHGRDLAVTAASLTPKGGSPVRARWAQEHGSGVASLTLDAVAPAGPATVHLEWNAPFDRRGQGLYRVDRNGDHYAFTQFEALSARRAFPSFDEPAFKVPFEVSLVVPEGAVAIANTHETKREKTAAGTRVSFGATPPLPTYLLAWAVGPLEVVDAPPIAPGAERKAPLPLRGIAARGRGKELAYALARAPEMVKTLEAWFGQPYPYEKLDLIAVPEKQGAMENAGAITFGEWLLLVDDKTATVAQKRAFASVTAHELAHHWFGDLVTMPWWDDIWLNEAFATWMGTRATQTFLPSSNAELSLVDRVQEAMGTDALAAARAVRQPIESEHDVYNAFDGITYQKGAGVLSMFERWVGREVFRDGVRAYLQDHAHGSGTSADLLAALSRAAKKDVATPFRTFLDRPGVPLVEAKLDCAGATPALVVTQSRYFPLGSKGDTKQSWQVPVCVRTPAGETCALVTDAEARIALPGKCPAWVLPNADAAGYYRFTLPKKELAALLGPAWPKLSTRERLAVVDAARVGWSRGTTRAGELFAALAPLANDPYPSIASAPMSYASTAREWLAGTPLEAKVEAWGRKVYAKAWAELGFSPKKGESAETTLRRSNVAWFLAFVARDPAVRKEASKRGHAFVEGGKVHPEAVDPNLAAIALGVAVEEDPALFDALLALLDKTEDETLRGRFLGALAGVTDPKLSARALALTLDPRLHGNEVLTPLWSQAGQHETRERAWAYLRAHFDAIVARVSSGRGGALPSLAGRFCDDKHRAEAEAFFRPRVEALEGGPRNLAAALESIDLCVARRADQEASVRAFFAE